MMRRFILLLCVLSAACTGAGAQDGVTTRDGAGAQTKASAQTKAGAREIDKAITRKEVTHIEETLSSDAMEGRAVFTPAIDRAADFIAARFKAAGLRPLAGNDYFQPFYMMHVTSEQVQVSLGGHSVPAALVAVQTSLPSLDWTSADSLTVMTLDKEHNLRMAMQVFRKGNRDMLILLDSASADHITQYNRGMQDHFSSGHSLVMAVYSGSLTSVSIHIRSKITQKPLKNVVGILPGKGRADEWVVFSAHYDHLGIGKPDEKGDSVYNGANDDASGTTAVLTLARYFAGRHDNERTLVFAAFTAEEIGEYGSQYFAGQMDAGKVMAMFNIEMIGTPSKWGNNSAYITGYERSDFGKILQKNLAGTDFQFYPDPYTTQNLFYRSDNASLARAGVPAHTISTSKMDSEPYYHRPGDEIGTLDMSNMTRIIHSIALSASSIISGEDTPGRVDTGEMR
jgi:hypothetical protein